MKLGCQHWDLRRRARSTPTRAVHAHFCAVSYTGLHWQSKTLSRQRYQQRLYQCRERAQLGHSTSASAPPAVGSNPSRSPLCRRTLTSTTGDLPLLQRRHPAPLECLPPTAGAAEVAARLQDMAAQHSNSTFTIATIGGRGQQRPHAVTARLQLMSGAHSLVESKHMHTASSPGGPGGGGGGAIPAGGGGGGGAPGPPAEKNIAT